MIIIIKKKLYPSKLSYYFHSAKSDIRYAFRDYSSWQSDTVDLFKNEFNGTIIILYPAIIFTPDTAVATRQVTYYCIAVNKSYDQKWHSTVWICDKITIVSRDIKIFPLHNCDRGRLKVQTPVPPKKKLGFYWYKNVRHIKFEHFISF